MIDRQAIRGLLDAERERQGLVGLAAALVQDGGAVASAGSGFAELEARTPCSGRTVFGLASVSKALTGTAAMALVEEGRLDLDSDVREYVPEFPAKPWPVTLRQLLSHTAGVRHYRDDAERANRRRFARLADALALFAGDALLFEPGTDCRYTSHGFTLLGCAVEAASGLGFTEFLRRRLGVPAGMEVLCSDFEADPARPPARRYGRPEGGELAPAGELDTSDRIPGGGLCSTAEDLVRFGAALLAGRLVSSRTRAEMLAPVLLPGGRPAGEDLRGRFLAYALGWAAHRDPHGRTVVGHGGGQDGARALLYMLSEERLTIAVLSNTNPGCDPYAVAEQLTAAALA